MGRLPESVLRRVIHRNIKRCWRAAVVAVMFAVAATAVSADAPPL